LKNAALQIVQIWSVCLFC